MSFHARGRGGVAWRGVAWAWAWAWRGRGVACGWLRAVGAALRSRSYRRSEAGRSGARTLPSETCFMAR